MGGLCHSGPSCSKLTTSLVNVSLKFQTLLSEICHFFLLKNIDIYQILMFEILTKW